MFWYIAIAAALVLGVLVYLRNHKYYEVRFRENDFTGEGSYRFKNLEQAELWAKGLRRNNKIVRIFDREGNEIVQP